MMTTTTHYTFTPQYHISVEADQEMAVRQWVTECCAGGYQFDPWPWPSGGVVVKLVSEQDFLMFKLRWGV